jgi:hypothetical protein
MLSRRPLNLSPTYVAVLAAWCCCWASSLVHVTAGGSNHEGQTSSQLTDDLLLSFEEKQVDDETPPALGRGRSGAEMEHDSDFLHKVQVG